MLRGSSRYGCNGAYNDVRFHDDLKCAELRQFAWLFRLAHSVDKGSTFHGVHLQVSRMTLDPSDVGLLGRPDSWVLYRCVKPSHRGIFETQPLLSIFTDFDDKRRQPKFRSLSNCQSSCVVSGRNNRLP